VKIAQPSATAGAPIGCADSDYRRLPYDIWRGRPGAEVLVAAMADLIAENERHLVAIERLYRRFDDLSVNGTWHEDLGPEVVPDELIRPQALLGSPV
jgi:hypothetical protein